MISVEECERWTREYFIYQKIRWYVYRLISLLSDIFAKVREQIREMVGKVRTILSEEIVSVNVHNEKKPEISAKRNSISHPAVRLRGFLSYNLVQREKR